MVLIVGGLQTKAYTTALLIFEVLNSGTCGDL
jgi:hypothetical protein